jgi:hypothetical protein
MTAVYDRELRTEALFYPEGLDRRPRAPQCSETGIPLLIAPYKKMDDLSDEDKNLHHVNYPKPHPLLQGIGGKAVRVARLQTVPKFLHNGPENTAFHTIVGDGIILPSTPEEQMGAVILQSAGFLPAEVVDTTHGDLCVREMQPWERKLLARPDYTVSITNEAVKQYRDKWQPGHSLLSVKRELWQRREAQAQMSYRDVYYGYAEIKHFIDYFAFEQDFNLLDQRKISDFRKDGDVNSSEVLLGELLGIASQAAQVKGLSLSATYKALYTQGRLAPGMPKSAALFMRYKLGNELSRPKLIEKLRQKVHALDRVA